MKLPLLTRPYYSRKNIWRFVLSYYAPYGLKQRLVKNLNDDICAFLALVEAGLWGNEVQLLSFGPIDFKEIYKIAESQSVVGLVSVGIGQASDIRIPKEDVLSFVGATLQIEHRNVEVNDFLLKLSKKIHNAGVFSLLIKGQGIAQCYEKPLWRTAGDVDLLLDENNYEKAKSVLFPIAYDIQLEDRKKKHQALKIMGVEVELHGKMHFTLSKRVDKELDIVIDDSLRRGGVCRLRVDETDVYLPNPDNHVIIVFTHYLHHFFIEGVGLRQICDWCRLLWTHRTELNVELLEHRLQKMGLITEWKVFASLAVNTLGMPVEAMSFYDSRFKVKGERVLRRILVCGNFGHNKDLSYRRKYTGITYKIVATLRRFGDFVSLTPVFPLDAPRFLVAYLFNKAKGAEE